MIKYISACLNRHFKVRRALSIAVCGFGLLSEPVFGGSTQWLNIDFHNSANVSAVPAGFVACTLTGGTVAQSYTFANLLAVGGTVGQSYTLSLTNVATYGSGANLSSDGVYTGHTGPNGYYQSGLALGGLPVLSTPVTVDVYAVYAWDGQPHAAVITCPAAGGSPVLVTNQGLTTITTNNMTYVGTSAADASGIIRATWIGQSAGTEGQIGGMIFVIHSPCYPVITLGGNNPTVLTVNSLFSETVSAVDSCTGGSVAVTVAGTVNATVPGTNILAYTAIADGITNTATRKVIVVNGENLNLDLVNKGEAPVIPVPTGFNALTYSGSTMTFTPTSDAGGQYVVSFANVSSSYGNANYTPTIDGDGYYVSTSQTAGFSLAGLLPGSQVTLYACWGWDKAAKAGVITFGGVTNLLTTGFDITAPSSATLQNVGIAYADSTGTVSGSWTGQPGQEGQVGGMIFSIKTTTNTTFVPDTNPPVVATVFNVGVTNVQIGYSKPVTAASAINPANYVFTNGLPVTGAVLNPDNMTVVLTTAAMTYGSNYSIVINGVLDRAVPPNTIAPNTQASFTAAPFAAQDIGSPAIASTDMFTTNGATINSAGSNIGGISDQCGFAYQLQTGNFDISVCLAGLGLSDPWAQAGLMTRASLAAGSPFAAALATPGMNGVFFADRAATGGLTVSSGSFPANYPNTWLRLSRVGNVFTGFGSYDGINWTQLGTVTLALPAQIYFGLAVASHNTGQVTTAQFLNYQTTPTNAVLSTMVNPHDAMGPTSRTTPIAISEIMYKPAPRTDGKSLEFLEIYNSNPWFQDIGGYQISCADMNYIFPAGTTIPGGGYLVVAAAPADIESVYGITNVMGPYTGSLKKSETLELRDERTNVLLTVPYSNVYPWPVAADGTGHSIVLACPTYGEGDSRAWDISDVVGGSPGRMDSFTPSPLRSVVINQFLAHTDPPDVDYIQLYNHSTNSVDVSGCILSDDPVTNKFVIPSGTIIPAGGFVYFTEATMGFGLNAAGESIYFKNPGLARVLDAVQFNAQQNGVATGRWPDGANDFYRLSAKTPGTNNARILISDVVINELMYDPISGNDDDQYVELFNRSTNAVDLSGWQLSDAISYTFPSGTLLATNGYIVVARNTANLFSKYPNLNSGNTVGNFSGKLSHNGEHIALLMPVPHNGTNINIMVNDLTYGTGGRWGEWSGGGGSSLELIDPNSNNRLAANWADSDETQKSVWTNIENTGVLDNGANRESGILHAQIGLLDAGECLVDNLEADYNSSNYVSNGTFEGGTNGWSFQGCLTRSSLENTGYASGHSLHIRCSDRIWTGDNSCQVSLNANPLASGQTVTLRFKARWLHGWPEALFRLNGNWLEAAGSLPVPVNLGSPGLPNSRSVTNAGPAIYNVTHNPPLPAASQPAVVTVQAHDPNGETNLTLHYRIDPATTYTTVPMKDDGTGGDAIAGDGVFSGTIPGQAANVLAAFYISATDSNGVTTRFPALRPGDNEPARECAVMFGDGNPGGSFGVYHLWLTQSNATRWASLSDLSNEGNDCTFVNGNRVIYNMQGRFAGSPYHQGFDTPTGNLCHYKWEFNDDDKFLGATDFNKLHQPGNYAGDDSTIQREQLANSFLRALGVPWLNRRYVAVYVNGNRRSTLMEDAQCPGGDVVKEHWPNDAGGFLYKMQPWFEMDPFPSGASMNFNENAWCDLMPYTTTGGVKKAARYRYTFEIRRTPDSASDFTNVFSLVDAANSSGTPNFVANLENLADMENWMRVFAANHAAGNWDSFGTQHAQNLYGYIGTLGTKYSLLMWDFNLVIGNGSQDPGQNLFALNSEDSTQTAIYSNPTFLRMYWRALQELVNGPLNVANSGPLLLAKYNAFVANGLNVENPAVNIEPWLTQAQSSIATQLAAVNATNFSVNASVAVSNNLATITGVAPVNVAAVWINGVAYPLTWITLTNWVVTLPLQNGTNQFNLTGVGRNGQLIVGDTNSISVVYTGTNTSPAGRVVINEIMYNPMVGNAQFVELYNNSTNTTYDLSGWDLQGLAYTFPAGATLAPTNYLVLAANNTAFAAAYGATNPVFGIFNGTLSANGEMLTLNTASNVPVARVRYESQPPWPTNAGGTGASLQLVDPLQDIWRVGNWSSSPFSATPGTPNNVSVPLVPFPSLWINELQADNLNGITNRAGQHTAWLELYNPGTNGLSLNGLYLANNYTNLLQWAFPTNALISSGQYKLIFADAQASLSTTNELHANFILPSGSGSLALTRLSTNGQSQVLDYVNYQNINLNDSYGSFPDGQSFNRQEFFQATPGAANNGTAMPLSSFIAYTQLGSVYTQYFDALPNPGLVSVNADNPATNNGVIYSLANPYDFAFPVVATGKSGGLGISALVGWYGSGVSAAQFGVNSGDQTTGGGISFGLSGSANRALGLLATSSTKGTAFGVRFINGTATTLTRMNLQFTGEVWRQSNVAKTLKFYYFVDPTGTNTFPTNATALLPALNVTIPTVAADSGGVAVDGSSSLNQTNISVLNQAITNWPPGAALWLVWQMTDSTGKAQGLGIDNLSFSASVPLPVPLNAQPAGSSLILNWTGVAGQTYQLEYKNNLTDPAWTPVGNPVTGSGGILTLTNDATISSQRFFHLRLVN